MAESLLKQYEDLQIVYINKNKQNKPALDLNTSGDLENNEGNSEDHVERKRIQKKQSIILKGTIQKNIENRKFYSEKHLKNLEESETQKIDVANDNKNPQYIPKEGHFYQHDIRSAMDEAEEVNFERENTQSTMTNKASKCKPPPDRWLHDRYDERKQAPKSKEELIATYGYDLRNNEVRGPQRHTNYGGALIKYTKNFDKHEYTSKDTSAFKRKPIVPPDTSVQLKKSSVNLRLQVNEINNATGVSKVLNQNNASMWEKQDTDSLKEQNQDADPITQIQHMEPTKNSQIVISDISISEVILPLTTSTPIQKESIKSRKISEVAIKLDLNINELMSTIDFHRSRNETISYAIDETSTSDFDNEIHTFVPSKVGIKKQIDEKAIRGFKNINNNLEVINNSVILNGIFLKSDIKDKTCTRSTDYNDVVNNKYSNPITSLCILNSKLKEEKSSAYYNERNAITTSTIEPAKKSIGDTTSNTVESSERVPKRRLWKKPVQPRDLSLLSNRDFQEKNKSQSDIPVRPSSYMSENMIQRDNVSSADKDVIQGGFSYLQNVLHPQVITPVGNYSQVVVHQIIGGTYTATIQYPAAAYLAQQPLNFAIPPLQQPQYQITYQPYSGNIAPQPGTPVYQYGSIYPTTQIQPIRTRQPQQCPTGGMLRLPRPIQTMESERSSGYHILPEPIQVPVQETADPNNIDHILDTMFVRRPYNPLMGCTSPMKNNSIGVSKVSQETEQNNLKNGEN